MEGPCATISRNSVIPEVGVEGPTAEACLWTEGTLSFVDLLVSTTNLTMGTKAVTKKKRYKGNVSNKKVGGNIGKGANRTHMFIKEACRNTIVP